MTLPRTLRASLAPALLALMLLAGLATGAQAQGIEVSFSATTYTVEEGAGSASLTVELSQSRSTATTVTVTATNDEATAGADYTAGPYTVTVAANQTSATLSIPITDDNLFEADEDFDVAISATGLPSGVQPGTPSTATVTIEDNEYTVTFGADAPGLVAEDVGTCVFQCKVITHSTAK